jgi:hypothetical protein
MRPRSLIRSRSGVVIATILGVSCSYGPRSPSPTPQQSQSTRKITRSSEQVVTVDSAKKVAAQVADFVTDAGGFVERSSETGHGGAQVIAKVPAPQVESIMNQVAALGHEERRALTAHDVTDQYTDLEARLKSAIAVRDRLEQLLAQTNGINEVLTVERELARVQADIEGMQAHLEQLKSQVQLAELSVTLQRKRQLGPLASVGVGIWHGLGKLF